MDYLAHGLWSFIAFHKTKRPKYAVYFGLLPDTFSWVIYFFYNVLVGTVGRPDLLNIPHWAMTLYGLTHSLIIFFIVIAFVYLISRSVPIYVWAWLLHILIDIPTHSRTFLPTPFLWPVSLYAFPGISWGTPWFMVLNYVLLAAALTVIFLRKKFKLKAKQPRI